MFTGFWIHLRIVCRPSIKFYTLAKSNLAGNFAIRVKRFDENHMVQNPTKYHYVIKVTNITRIKLISMPKHETNQIVIVPWSKKLQVVLTSKFACSFSFDVHIQFRSKSVGQRLTVFARKSRCITSHHNFLLINSALKSQFNYCPLIWIFLNVPWTITWITSLNVHWGYLIKRQSCHVNQFTFYALRNLITCKQAAS